MTVQYNRVIVRYGVSSAIPSLQTAELGYDTDTLTFRIGDNTPFPQKVMTTKSTGSFVFNADNVTYKNISVAANGKVDGLSLSTMNQVQGLVYRTSLSGIYKNITFGSSDGLIISSMTNTDATNIIDLRLNPSVSDALKFNKLGGAWQTIVDLTNNPPAIPEEGDVYAVNTAPVGLFSGQANKLALYTTNAGWIFKSVLNRSLARTLSGTLYEKTASGWIPYSLSGAHQHSIADIVNLQTTLNGKAALSHSHTIANVQGLQTALNAKAALVHTHTISSITGLQTAIDTSNNTKVSKTGDSMTGDLQFDNNNNLLFKNNAGNIIGGSEGTLISKQPDDNLYIDNYDEDTVFRGKGYSEFFRIGKTGRIYFGADSGDNTKVLVGNAFSSPTFVSFETFVKNPSSDYGIVPTGSVIAMAGYNIPAGYIVADGAALSRDVYSRLFSVISTIYGIGDGVTTFNIPDLRGEFIRGWDNFRGVDPGRAFGSWQDDQFRSHTHSITAFDTGPVNGNYAGGTSAIYASTTSAAGGSETRPRNYAMYFLIKY